MYYAMLSDMILYHIVLCFVLLHHIDIVIEVFIISCYVGITTYYIIYIYIVVVVIIIIIVFIVF